MSPCGVIRFLSPCQSVSRVHLKRRFRQVSPSFLSYARYVKIEAALGREPTPAIAAIYGHSLAQSLTKTNGAGSTSEARNLLINDPHFPSTAIGCSTEQTNASWIQLHPGRAE